MSPNNEGTENTVGTGQESTGPVPPAVVTTPQPPAAQPPATVDESPNIQLGKDGRALPEGPAVIGTKVVEIPNEDGQRSGFRVAPEMVSVIISQFPDFQFKERKSKG